VEREIVVKFSDGKWGHFCFCSLFRYIVVETKCNYIL